MKKNAVFLIFIAFALLSLFAAGCGGTTADVSPTEPGAVDPLPQPEPEPDPQPEPEPEEPYAKAVLMAGQSNMLGCTLTRYLSPDSIGQTRYERISKPFETVRMITEPAASVEDFEPVRLGMGASETCFGPEAGMAETLSERFPGETVYLIKVAVGGSSLARDWTPTGYNTVYFRRVADSGLKALADAGLNPKIVGLCWMQGEADAEYPHRDWSESYRTNLSVFVAGMRDHFAAFAREEQLPFIDAYISQSTDWTYYAAVNAAKRAFAGESENNRLLDTLAPGLMEPGTDGLIYFREDTTLSPDIKHYDSASMLKLGNMFGEAVAEICGG